MVYEKVNVVNNKYTLANLYNDKTLEYYLKARKETSIKGHKTAYYLQDKNYNNFSSIFTEPNHQTLDSKNITGNFPLELGETYYLDNKENNYKLVLDFNTAVLTKLEVQNELF
jgi:hypothetical protein